MESKVLMPLLRSEVDKEGEGLWEVCSFNPGD